jgi:hypothetical protein
MNSRRFWRNPQALAATVHCLRCGTGGPGHGPCQPDICSRPACTCFIEGGGPERGTQQEWVRSSR